MDRQGDCYKTQPDFSPTYTNPLMTVRDAVQGVGKLNINHNLYVQCPNIHPPAYLDLYCHQRQHMSGLGRDFCQIRHKQCYPACKKKTFCGMNGVDSAFLSHGGKKRRENDNIRFNQLSAPWIVRDYCLGLNGLHEEIQDFYHYMRPTDEECCMRKHVIQSVSDVVRRLWPSAKLDVFGSFRTNLYLPTSDIDIVVFGNGGSQSLFSLKDELINKGITDESSVKVLHKAAVPIIKFTHREAGIMVDISFNTQSGVECVQLVMDFIVKYPVLPKLVFVLKQFLLVQGLNEVWTGGLSSYSVLLLCVSFFQQNLHLDATNPNVNLGALLIEFFNLYGCRFAYEKYCVSVKEGRYMTKDEFRLQLDDCSTSYLSIEDPLTRGNDLGKGSYRMWQVVNAFKWAYFQLHSYIVLTHEHYNGHRSTSWLSTIIEVSENVIEKRQKSCEKWRMCVATPPSLGLSPRSLTDSSASSIVSSFDTNSTNPTYTSSEGYSSSSSTESDLDDQQCLPPPSDSTPQRLIHRAKSMNCVLQVNSAAKKLKEESHKSATRTHSADSKLVNLPRYRPRSPLVLNGFIAKDCLNGRNCDFKHEISVGTRLSTKECRPVRANENGNIKMPEYEVTKRIKQTPHNEKNKVIIPASNHHKSQLRSASNSNRGRPTVAHYPKHCFNRNLRRSSPSREQKWSKVR